MKRPVSCSTNDPLSLRLHLLKTPVVGTSFVALLLLAVGSNEDSPIVPYSTSKMSNTVSW